jgi:hypothetical protein
LVKSSWGLAHPMSLTELALLDGRRPLPLWGIIGLTLTLTLTLTYEATARFVIPRILCGYSLCALFTLSRDSSTGLGWTRKGTVMSS